MLGAALIWVSTWGWPVEVHIRVSGGDAVAELPALEKWLAGERDLSGRVRAVRRPPREGELGAVSDMLAVALGSGGAGVALARSLTVWLRTRRPEVTVTVTSPSGSVEIEARRIKDTDVLPLLEKVLRDEP